MDDDVLERARRAAAELDGRWFADFEEICSFAAALVEIDVLTTRRDVVDFFRRPWRFSAEHDVWVRCGRPVQVHGSAGAALEALMDAAGRGDTPLALTQWLA
ncbi:hypothetical protein QN239_33135 [Mycolicibacterium sp. Y3]